jgi:hypothetical protein
MRCTTGTKGIFVKSCLVGLQIGTAAASLPGGSCFWRPKRCCNSMLRWGSAEPNDVSAFALHGDDISDKHTGPLLALDWTACEYLLALHIRHDSIQTPPVLAGVRGYLLRIHLSIVKPIRADERCWPGPSTKPETRQQAYDYEPPATNSIPQNSQLTSQHSDLPLLDSKEPARPTTMSFDRPLRGGCHCGRNLYIIQFPKNYTHNPASPTATNQQTAQVLFNSRPSHRKPALPISPVSPGLTPTPTQSQPSAPRSPPTSACR